MGGKGGTIPRAPDHHGSAESLRGSEMSAGDVENPSNFTSTFFNTVNFLPEDLRFEHGGAKRASGPGRHLTSLRPCAKRIQMVVTVRFTIRVFVTFLDCKDLNAIKPSREKM